MSARIRPAGPEDAVLISALNAEVHDLHAQAEPRFFKPADEQTFPPQAVRALMDVPGHLFYLAIVEREPVGYIYFEIRLLEENNFRHAVEQAYIHQLGVRREFHRQGIGKQLIEAVKDLAVERGLQMIALDTWAFNQQAQDFFDSQGFEPFNLRYWMWL